MNKLVHQGGEFELRAKLNREPMEFPEYRSCPSVLYSALSPVVHGDIALNINISTKIQKICSTHLLPV